MNASAISFASASPSSSLVATKHMPILCSSEV
jgi:hypothetical protein